MYLKFNLTMLKLQINLFIYVLYFQKVCLGPFGLFNHRSFGKILRANNIRGVSNDAWTIMMELEKAQTLKVTNKNAAIDILYNIGKFKNEIKQ